MMKLLIADDHTLFRDALTQYIKRAEPDSVVNVAKDFEETIELLEEEGGYELILLDLRMPGMDGIEGLGRLRDKFPKTPVALMSGIAETRDVQKAMEMGAIGYFPKTLSGKALIKGIKKVLGGEVFIPKDEATNTVLPSYYTNSSAWDETVKRKAEQVNLTPREAEVLVYLSRGASNKEIANALNLQVVTIKLHVRGICRKLNAKNRTQAVVKAQEMGLTG